MRRSIVVLTAFQSREVNAFEKYAQAAQLILVVSTFSSDADEPIYPNRVYAGRPSSGHLKIVPRIDFRPHLG